MTSTPHETDTDRGRTDDGAADRRGEDSDRDGRTDQPTDGPTDRRPAVTAAQLTTDSSWLTLTETDGPSGAWLAIDTETEATTEVRR